MSDAVQKAIGRLSTRLPLQHRQQALPAGYLAIHRAILCTLASGGRPPGRSQLAALLPDGSVDAALDFAGRFFKPLLR